MSLLSSPAIVTAYENSSQHDPSSNTAMLGVHASASAIIQYGKIARKQGLVNVALDILSRIHTIPTVPIVDCFQKIRQQVKCYLQLAGVMGKNECMQVGCQVDPVPVLALAVRVPGPAPGSDDRERDWAATGLLGLREQFCQNEKGTGSHSSI